MKQPETGLTQPLFSTDLAVRYHEMDAMGVVHHSVYWLWLEMARTQFIELRGFHYAALEERGFSLPLLKGDITYQKPAKFGDSLEIAIMQVKRLRYTQLFFSYRISRLAQRGKAVEFPVVLCQASTTHVFVDKNGKPIKFPTCLRELFVFD